MPDVAIILLVGGEKDLMERVRRAAPGVTVLAAASLEAARSSLDALSSVRFNPAVVGDVLLDRDRHEARCGSAILELSELEFRLLSTLVTTPGKAFSYQELYENAWSLPYLGDPTPVRSAVKRLRRKLVDIDCAVVSIRGYGVRLAVRRDTIPAVM